MQLRRLLIALLIISITAMAVSGCVTNTPAPTASPTLQSTPMPTPVKQWPPATIGTTQSSQVAISDIKVSCTRDPKARQSENFTFILTNNGRSWANNTFVSLMVTDAQTDEYYYSGQFNVGNLYPHETRLVNLSTKPHDYGFSVLVKLKWYWGDDLEFTNSFTKAYTLPPVDTYP